MAQTLGNQVQSLAGLASAYDNIGLDPFPIGASVSDALVNAARQVADLLPPDLLARYATEVTIPTTGLSIVGKRLLTVRCGSSPSMQVPLSLRAAVSDETSFNYATSMSPRHFFHSSALYLVPGNGKATVFTYPFLSGEEETIRNFPPGGVRMVALLAAMHCILVYMRSVQDNLASLTVDTSGQPTPPGTPSLTGAALDPIPPITAFEASMPAALDLTTQFGEVTAYFDTDEDIEMARSKLEEIDRRMGEWVAENTRFIESATARFRASIEAVRLAVEHNIKEAELLSNQEATEYTLKLRLYDSQLQGYNASVQSQLAAIQGMTTRLQAFVSMGMTRYRLLKEEFMSELSATVAGAPYQPQQEKS